MTANPALAKARGISSENQKLISGIHDYLKHIISIESPKGFNQEIFDEIETLEFELQRLWDFSQDADFHTWKHQYEFKCQWALRTFVCLDTNVEYTIPLTVREGQYFTIGLGAIDVGRLNSYSRVIGNVVETLDIENIED